MDTLARAIQSIPPDVFGEEDRRDAMARAAAEASRRGDAANARDAAGWARVTCREEWEAFARSRLAALRRSLGQPVATTGQPAVHVARTVEGDGYRVENLVIESRPGLLVSANLYSPIASTCAAPAIVIVHSHHVGKRQGELQDMGAMWARVGCHVLVMDQLGYGERQDHSPGPRQEYRGRYMTGTQLHVTGDSLMGWMVHDIRRGIDALLTREGVDPKAIIVMGAVAGGGDPAAVAAALDERISCVIPFNFGGPQPEAAYPLPDDAATTFNYMGVGSWESTRNLRLSGRDGFLPWSIVASVAPRRLIYAHEFAWDRERDPVWGRLERVYDFYGARDSLAYTHGAGGLSGSPPEATHCNQMGPQHRVLIHEALERWYGIPIPDDIEERRDEEDFVCFTPAMRERVPVRPTHVVIRDVGRERLAAAKAEAKALTEADQVTRLQREWGALLGVTDPGNEATVETDTPRDLVGAGARVTASRTTSGASTGWLILTPRASDGRAVVLCVAQRGKRGFLAHRSAEIADLLGRDITVCLADLPGTGELQPDSDREWRGAATASSATEWMLGASVLGAQLTAMRALTRYLRGRWPQCAVWGDSFAGTNPPDFSDPLIGEGVEPRLSEPGAGLLAILTALFEPCVTCVVAGGTLAGYASLLDHTHCYIPHDAVVPGALNVGDIPALIETLGPRRVLTHGTVDGRNTPVSEATTGTDVVAWLDTSLASGS